MKIDLDPGDEIVAMVRAGSHFIVVTKRGRFYEVWYEGAPGCYRVNHL